MESMATEIPNDFTAIPTVEIETFSFFFYRGNTTRPIPPNTSDTQVWVKFIFCYRLSGDNKKKNLMFHETIQNGPPNFEPTNTEKTKTLLSQQWKSTSIAQIFDAPVQHPSKILRGIWFISAGVL